MANYHSSLHNHLCYSCSVYLEVSSIEFQLDHEADREG